MRIAVDDADPDEREPPGGEHRGGEPIAHRERGVLVIEQLGAFEPVERQQPSGRELGPHLRHADEIDVREHVAIERDVLRLAAIVELLAHPRADLLDDLAGVDRRIEAAADREQEFELLEVRLDRRLHVGVLQLAGERAAVERFGAMHLAERGGSGRLMLEVCELLLPVGAELRLHAALDEGPAHRRRLALQLGELLDVFRRQRLGDGGEELRHLHDRALSARRAPRRAPAAFLARSSSIPKKRAPAMPRGDAADIGADAGVAARRGRRSGLLRVVRSSRLSNGHDSNVPGYRCIASATCSRHGDQLSRSAYDGFTSI